MGIVGFTFLLAFIIKFDIDWGTKKHVSENNNLAGEGSLVGFE